MLGSKHITINQPAIVLPLYFGGSFSIMNKHYDGISKSQKIQEISIRNGKKSFQDLNGELDFKKRMRGYVTTWMNLEKVMLSEISQAQEVTYYMILFI